METQLQLLCTLLIIVLIYLSKKTDGNSNDVLVVKQSERLTVELGGSVTINCTFEADYNTYSVTWFLGCENKSNLLDHPCYKHRVRFDNNKRQVIISNLTESDSGMYCCNVEVANGKKGAGNGTRVEVKQRQCPEAEEINPTACIIQYSFLGFEACIIVILLALLLKYHLQSSASDKCKVQLEGQELERGLQYAEICKQRFPSHPRSRHREEKITYASVTTK